MPTYSHNSNMINFIFLLYHNGGHIIAGLFTWILGICAFKLPTFVFLISILSFFNITSVLPLMQFAVYFLAALVSIATLYKLFLELKEIKRKNK